MNRLEFEQMILGRRGFLRLAGVGLAGLSAPTRSRAEDGGSTNIIEFEEKLAAMRAEYYRHPKIDILKTGFRPIGGKVADFAVAELRGRYHFFYIERRLQEGTPFYPGHEIYFGHASTPDFFNWEVHEPVMIVRPDSWEESHVWAPFILKRGDEYVMVYTGVNRHISQNIGLASSADLFTWKRWDSNPISPCKDRPWAYWHEDRISSCRDPQIVEHDGQFWMIYTANTKTGASCIALCSTRDLKTWEDHGPILTGPTSGYEPKLEGGHKQGSLESAYLLNRKGKWYLLVKAALRGIPYRQGIIPGDRIDAFDFANGWQFWKEGVCIEVVKEREGRALIAGMVNGFIKFAEVDWSADRPAARTLETKEELAAWQG